MSYDAVADYRGKFIQGQLSTLFLKITDLYGNPKDAANISISINDPAGALFDSGTPVKVSDGYYAWDWEVALTATVGDYSVTWTYIVDSEIKTELQTVTVADDGDISDYYSGKVLAFREALTSYVFCAQAIPVYFEQAKPTEDKRTYYFTFPRWNQSAQVRVYRNKSLIQDGLEVNYFKGYVRFTDPQSDFDLINADYNFKWFADEQLDDFLLSALRVFNQFPPYTNYNLMNLPDRHIPSVIYKAATDALRHLMLCLQFQEPQQVFGGSEKVQQAFSNFETLKKNYEEEWKLLFENKKKFGYIGLTKVIVTPEFTMPGGRSRWFRQLFK